MGDPDGVTNLTWLRPSMPCKVLVIEIKCRMMESRPSLLEQLKSVRHADQGD